MSEVSDILQKALSGSGEEYRNPEGFVKWGKVERDINCEFDKLQSKLDCAVKALEEIDKEEGVGGAVTFDWLNRWRVSAKERARLALEEIRNGIY